MSRRFVAVTFGEIVAWHASGETRLLRSRIVDLPVADPVGGDPVIDGDPVRMLLRRLPPIAVDDEEGVLIARLSPGSLDDASGDSQLASVPIGMLDALVPLTTRAKAILDDRLAAYGMVLQPPWFQDLYRSVSYVQRTQSSRRAADTLASVFFPKAEWGVTDALTLAAEQALAQKDFEDGSGVGPAREPVPVTWISVAFGRTRRAPDGKGALVDLYDAGTVLKQMSDQLDRQAFADALERLRNCVKSIKARYGDGQAGVREVLCCDEFVAAAGALQCTAPEAFPAPLGALVLYLRWQEQFHAAGPAIDIRRLSNDLRELSSAATGDVVAAALWLLGYYAGCDRVMPLWYATQSPSPSWFRGRTVSVECFEPAAVEPTAGTDGAVAPGTKLTATIGTAPGVGVVTVRGDPTNSPAATELEPRNASVVGVTPDDLCETPHVDWPTHPSPAPEMIEGTWDGGVHAVTHAPSVPPSPVGSINASIGATLERGETGSLLPDGRGAPSDDMSGGLPACTGSGRKRAGRRTGRGGTSANKPRGSGRNKPKPS